ncbi:hypothetical protein SAMN05216191_108103 [Paenibacillus jilunlii]|uniref:Uncharacterized protein n=1 Tax=Paenibacillus jilunlii TaxID=682956 RepID=A0A1G9Q541_9BACL|nr:hypothetical protein SAMN05216191_108103 [Paenibacillus jilunlii]
MELEERMRPPLSADFHREQRYKSRNLQTTAAGSPNILRSPDEVPNVNILSSLYIDMERKGGRWLTVSQTAYSR